MWVFCNNGDNYFKDSFSLWEFKCTQEEILFQLNSPALVSYSCTIPDSPVFVKQFSPGQPQHFTHGKFQSKWSQSCVLDAERVERYLKCILQRGRKMGFLINVQDTYTQICSLIAVQSTSGGPLTSSAHFPAPQRDSLWLLSSILLGYFATRHFICVLGITTVEHQAWWRHQAQEGLFEVQFSSGILVDLRTSAHFICLSLPVHCNSLPFQLFHSEFFWKMLKADQGTYLFKNNLLSPT